MWPLQWHQAVTPLRRNEACWQTKSLECHCWLCSSFSCLFSSVFQRLFQWFCPYNVNRQKLWQYGSIWSWIPDFPWFLPWHVHDRYNSSHLLIIWDYKSFAHIRWEIHEGLLPSCICNCKYSKLDPWNTILTCLTYFPIVFHADTGHWVSSGNTMSTTMSHHEWFVSQSPGL